MSAPIIAALAAVLLDEEHKRRMEDPDYEPTDFGSVSWQWIVLMFVVITGGMVASIYVGVNFGFWWGILSATITGLSVGLLLLFDIWS